MPENVGKLCGNCALAAGLIAAASVLAPPFRAQNSNLGVVRVSTSSQTVLFYVDGQPYRTAQTFNWPAGSKHTLFVDPVECSVRPGVRCAVRGWRAGQTALAEGNPVTVTSDPSIAEFQAQLDVEYALSISYFDCGPDPSIVCQSPGKIYVGGGNPITSSTILWTGANSQVTLQAVPNQGYVFAGWGGSTNQSSQGFLNTITMTGPATVTPIFQVARPIRFETDPPELQVVADRANLYTPKSLDWGRGSVHTVAAVSPQQDKGGRWWIWSSWSDGGALTHAYTVADAMAPDTLTASYSPALRATVETSPRLLRVRIDGRDAAPPYNFIWGVKEKHRLEAPARQTDSQGRTWEFQGWSDGLEAAHEITVPGDSIDLGLRVVAVYRQLGSITVTSNLPGGSARVDDAECALPCKVERPIGQAVRISAPATVALGEDSRGEFDRWSDGAAGTASVEAAAEPRTLAANYRVLNRLMVSSDPAEAAVCRTVPESSDGFFEKGSMVAVTMAARPGFRFRRWEGDLAGNSSTASVVMSSPRSARAGFERVPYVAPAGVRNAAGEAEGAGVAPGSVISISGANLAGDVATGPENPLLQALADVTVRVGDRLLPLFFVSPERITAQLPGDLPEGTSVLAVRWANQPEVRAEFRVVRNAPGLFRNFAGEKAWAVALHGDGSAVTNDAPARPGETVTLLGSGFGPAEPQRPLGFAVPAGPVFRLVDAVTAKVGDRAIAAEAAYAAPGRTGVDAVEVRLPDDLASGEAVALSVECGGSESNVVYLPVQ